jgi:hypothetical protein
MPADPVKDLLGPEPSDQHDEWLSIMSCSLSHWLRHKPGSGVSHWLRRVRREPEQLPDQGRNGCAAVPWSLGPRGFISAATPDRSLGAP